jgi:hypothetical protein
VSTMARMSNRISFPYRTTVLPQIDNPYLYQQYETGRFDLFRSVASARST